MGRPPSNGGPSFRFTPPEIAEMESILQAHKTAMPERQVLVNLSEKFSNSEERKGKIEVQMKQVWNWFQNRRYAIRAKQAKYPGKLDISQMPRDNSAPMVKSPQPPPPAATASATVRTLPQPPQQPTVPSAAVRTVPQAPAQPAFSAQNAGRVTDNSQMEYEAKSARDGAWYDVSTFLSHRSLDTGDPEVMVRFAGFGAEEDEWVNVRKNVRQRSLPCEASECVAVLPADLILCFQEGKEQALYFDAHVLDAQRRRHDVRGCRCRFLVRYDHDQSEEIVALRKICRRPETDYRLQQLHAVNESLSVNQNKNGTNNNNIHTASTLRVYPPAEVQPKQNSAVPPPQTESPQKRQRVDSTVQPEGSQTQLKVEPVVLGDVPQNQQGVQPAGPTSSAQPLVEPPKESVVPSPSTQASAELKNVVPMVVTRSDEVPLESHKDQPVMPDPSTEVSVDTHMVETVVPSAGEATQELPTVETNVAVPSADAPEEHNKTEPVPSGEIPQKSQAVGPTVPPSAEITVEAPVESHEREPEVAEPQKEPVISASSAEVPAELQEVQPAVPDEVHTTKTEESMVHVSSNVVEEEAIETKGKEPVPTQEEAIETKTEEPAVSTNNPNVVEESVVAKTEEPVELTNDPNVVEESIETKTEEPVNDHNMIEAEIEKPHLSETMENNEEKHEEVAENVSDKVVENSDLEPENTAVAMEEG